MSGEPVVVAAPAVQPVSDQRLHSMARSGTLGMAGAAVSAAVGFLVTVVAARGLGAAGSGVVAAVWALSVVASNTGELGADTGLVRELARLRALERRRDLIRVALLALGPVAVVTVAAAGAVWYWAPRLAAVAVPDAPPEAVVELLRVLAVALPFGALSMVALGGTRGLGSVRPMVLVESLGKPLLRLALTAAALAAGAGVLGVVTAWAVPVVLGCLVALVLLWRILRATAARAVHDGGPTAPTSVGRLAREFWSFSAPRGVAAFVEVLGTTVGVLLTSALAGAQDAGIFNAVTRFVLVGTLVLQAVRMAIAPHLSALLARNERAEAERLHRVSTVWVMALSWPVYLFSLAAAGPVLEIFGSEFSAEGAVGLAVLSLAMLVNLTTGNLGTVALMSGHSGWNLTIALGSLAVNVGGCLLLVPTLGATGAALAWALCLVAEKAAMWVLVRRVIGLRTLSRPLLPLATVSTLLFAVPTAVAAAIEAWAVLPVGCVSLALYLYWLWRRRAVLHGDELIGALTQRFRRPKERPA